MKKRILLIVLGLLLNNSISVLAQGFASYEGFDLDTSKLEWSAMGSTVDYVLISTVDQPDSNFMPLGMALGDIRLRWYTIGPWASMDPSYDTTFHFAGHARITQIRSGGNSQFYLAGTFRDTLIVGADTLINPAAGILTPFVIKIDRNGILWHWGSSQTQHSFVQQIRTDSELDNKLLIVGRENDRSAFMLSLNIDSGTVIWKEIVSGTNTLSDIFLTYRHTSDLLVTGVCLANAQPFGLALPNGLPNTPYRSFLYKRDLSNNTAQFMEVVSLNSAEILPEIKDMMNNVSFEFYWATPAFFGTTGLMTSYYRLTPPAVYTMIGSSFSPLSGLVYLSQLGRTNGGSLGGGKGHFGMFTNQGNNATEIKISFPGWGTQFATDLSLSIPSVSPWLGRFELAQVWVATKFGHSLSYSNYYNPNGTITFPGIDNQHPRWAVIRSTSLLTVPALKSELVFDIYPNPVDNHQFTIRLAENSNIPAQWVIRDMQGRQLLQGEINLFENKIVLPDLASGLYFLEVKSGLKFGSQKVIIH